MDVGKRETEGVGYIIHVSDVHVDPDYVVGSASDCGYPLCCRAINGKGTSEHYAGKFGPTNPANCDVPMATVDSWLDDTEAFVQRPDLVGKVWGIATGDFVPHNVWNQSVPYDINDITKLFDKIAAKLPNIQIYPCLGNHEGKFSL